MMYLCIVIEVNQNSSPETTIVMIPGTHPRTLRKVYQLDHRCVEDNG